MAQNANVILMDETFPYHLSPYRTFTPRSWRAVVQTSAFCRSNIYIACILTSTDTYVRYNNNLNASILRPLAPLRRVSFARNRNVWLFGEADMQYPTLIEVCNNLLPDDVAREYPGTRESNDSAGSTGTVEGDRKRRADTNSRAKEASVSVGTSRKKVKAEASGSAAMTDQFKGVLATVVEAFKPEPLRAEHVTSDSGASIKASACLSTTAIDRHLDYHGKCVDKIEKEEGKGDKADPWRLRLLKRQRVRLTKKIEELMDDDLKRPVNRHMNQTCRVSGVFEMCRSPPPPAPPAPVGPPPTLPPPPSPP